MVDEEQDGKDQYGEHIKLCMLHKKLTITLSHGERGQQYEEVSPQKGWLDQPIFLGPEIQIFQFP